MNKRWAWERPTDVPWRGSRRHLLHRMSAAGAVLLLGCAGTQSVTRAPSRSGELFEAMLGAWLDLRSPCLVIRTVLCDYVFELPKYWARVFSTPASLSLLLVEPRALAVGSDGSVEGLIAFSVPRLYLTDAEDSNLRASNWSTVRAAHPYLTKSVLMMVGDHVLGGRRFQNRVMSSSADRSFAELVLRTSSPSDALVSMLPTSPIRLDATRAMGPDGNPLTPVLLPPRMARLSSAE